MSAQSHFHNDWESDTEQEGHFDLRAPGRGHRVPQRKRQVGSFNFLGLPPELQIKIVEQVSHFPQSPQRAERSLTHASLCSPALILDSQDTRVRPVLLQPRTGLRLPCSLLIPT